MDVSYAAKLLGALFAVMNPFVSLPIFLSLTAGQTAPEQRRTAILVSAYSAILCAVVALAGQGIIGFFGIGIDAFRVAGGIVLASIALAMLSGQPITAHERSVHERHGDPASEASDDISFYPMTFPMVVGPGTIATLLVHGAHATGTPQYIALGVVLAGILLLLFLILFFASAIGRFLSDRLRVITTRLMGMILLAIAVEMMADGAKALLPGI